MAFRFATLLLLGTTLTAHAGQAPFAASAPDILISGRDRFYTSDQFSNTVSVINPAEGKLLGVIRLGDPTPGNLSPLYRGQLLQFRQLH
jgi:DNA-binding beta-propeller fold protein YncE